MRLAGSGQEALHWTPLVTCLSRSGTGLLSASLYDVDKVYLLQLLQGQFINQQSLLA